jgi:ankyrin repeat protein
MMSSVATMEPVPHGPTRQSHQPRCFAEFLWHDRDVYGQRGWLGALCKDADSRLPAQHVSSFPAAASAGTPLASPSAKQLERRRRRMSAGSTLRTIGEQSILAGAAASAQPGAMYTMDVKAWPAFSHYKATLAQLNGQRARMKIMIGANGVLGGQSKSPPLVVKGRRVVSVPALQPRPGQALPPTFASIMAKPSTAPGRPPSKPASKDPSCTCISSPYPPHLIRSILVSLHLIRLAVIDGQEGKACALLRECFGIPLEPALELSKAALPTWTGLLPRLGPVKLELLSKPKLWPALLRIWMRAVERGMETLLLMLYAAGIPRYPQGPLSFLAPKKPPKTSGSGATMGGVISAASSIISSSTVSGWLERNYRDWVRGRFPSFFMAAIAFGRSVLVRAILSQRRTSSLLASTWLGITPLLLASAEASVRRKEAAKRGRLWIVKELLDNGAAPLASGISLYTLLHLQDKLKPKRRGHRKQSPAHGPHAAERKVTNRHAMVSPEMWATGKVLYPVELAAASGNFELVIALLARSSLHRYQLGLLLQGDLDISIRLIKGGALIHPTDAHGNGPVHWAAAKGQLDLLGVLLHYGAPIDAANVNGWTPLHQAAYYSHRQLVRYLIEAGADCSTLNSDGLTALQVARRHGLASEDLLDYFTAAKGPATLNIKGDMDALLRQVEAFSLEDDRDPLPSPAPEDASAAAALPLKQRRGRFLIERIISLPRHWLSSSSQQPDRPASPQV